MVLEDFTTYTETDPSGHIAKVAHHIDFDAYRDETALVYKDFGAAHFGDFTHTVEGAIDADFDDAAEGFIWMLSNNPTDYGSIATAGETAIGIAFYVNDVGTNDYEARILETFGGSFWLDSTGPGVYGFAIDQQLYFVITKLGTALTCKIYTDAGHTALLDTLTLVLHANHKFQYVYGCSSENDGNTLHVDLNIDNLDLKEGALAKAKPILMGHKPHTLWGSVHPKLRQR
jgi:hypothetical protein